MIEVVPSGELFFVPDWQEQLADLTRSCWTSEAGTYEYRNPAALDPAYWETLVMDELNETHLSLVALDGDRIVAHVGLHYRPDLYGGAWEIGAGLAAGDAPRGTVTSLLHAILDGSRLDDPRGEPPRLVARCIMADTAMQRSVGSVLGMRFAGIDLIPGGRVWEAFVLFDNHGRLVPHEARPGVLGDPFGAEIPFDEGRHRAHLDCLVRCVSTERGRGIPPRHAHVHVDYLASVRAIVDKNSPATLRRAREKGVK